MNEPRTGTGHVGHGGASSMGAGGNANQGAIHPAGSHPPMQPSHAPGDAPGHGPVRAHAHPPKDNGPVPLEGEDLPAEEVKSKIHGITGMAGMGAGHHNYKRASHANKSGAVRMRTFHCRLSEQGVEHLDESINSWLDQHPEIEVKFSTSVIGQWDGKLKEPTLIVNVWY